MAKYSIEDTTLTAIADEIRNKTGLTDSIDNEQMVIDIASLPPLTIGDVPAYVQTEAERVADVVKALQSDNTLSFIAMSDVHVGSDTQSRNSALHAAQAANIIKKNAPIDFSVVLGDIVTGGTTDTLDVHLDNHMQVKRTLAIADLDAELGGNHDSNPYNEASHITAGELYKYQGRHNIDVVKPTTETDRNYFYFDIESKKTRVVCLNTADLKGLVFSAISDGHYISAYQLQWLVATLDMTGKTDWKIIVLSHHPIHWYNSMTNILAVLNAYVEGSSGSVRVDNTTISFDFSGKNTAKLVGCFHGHTHNFINGKVGDNEIIRMGTPNACFGGNNSYGSSSYNSDFRQKYGEVTVEADGTLKQIVYAKTANSAKDTAFCVYTIDFENEVIFATCYGAGYDRHISWKDVVQYTISNVLTGVSTNNSATVIEQGSNYTATLSVADTYTLKSLVVTMGGTDITDTVVNDLSAVNQILISTDESGAIYNGIGYKDSCRLGSSNTENTLEGYTSTGYIPVVYGDTISTKNVSIDGLTSTPYCLVFDSNKSLIVAKKMSEVLTVDESGNGTIDSTLFGINGMGQCYIRIVYATNENAILTVNEEIDKTGK